MPRPKTEQDAWTEELNDLPALIENYQRELEGTPEQNRELRERLAWQIKRAENRAAELRARLAPEDAPDRDGQERTR